MNIRQSLSWLNTIDIGDDEARDFYNATRSVANKDAWLRQMQGDGRQPLVLTATTASDASTCWFFHSREALGQGVVDHLDGNLGISLLGMDRIRLMKIEAMSNSPSGSWPPRWRFCLRSSRPPHRRRTTTLGPLARPWNSFGLSLRRPRRLLHAPAQSQAC